MKHDSDQKSSRLQLMSIFHTVSVIPSYIVYEWSLREAMELASQAMQASKFEDWYWKVQMGKCYFRLGMFRDSEKMFKSALKQQEMIDTFLLLAKVYIRLVFKYKVWYLISGFVKNLNLGRKLKKKIPGK